MTLPLEWPALQFQSPEANPAGIALADGTYTFHQRRGGGYTWRVELPEATWSEGGHTCRSLGAAFIDDGGTATAICPSGSAWERAYSINPPGGEALFIGTRAHGFEQDTGLTVTIDGQTLTPDTAPSWGGEVGVVRTSTLHHPDAAAAIGNATTTYTLTGQGLDVSNRVLWMADLTVGQCYGAMMPILGLLDAGRTTSSTKVTMNDDDGTMKASSQSRTAWLWDDDGSIGVAMTILDLATVANWEYGDGKHTWLQDRAGTTFNKIYAGFTGRNITNGDVWTSEVRYMADHFAAGAAITLDR